MYKNSIVHYIAKYMVDVLFYLGIVATALVPLWSKYIAEYMEYTRAQWYFLIVTLLLSGVALVYILFMLKGMFKTLLGNNPFVNENVNAFRHMALACVVVSLVFFVKCFWLFSITTMILSGAFAIGTLFCLVLKDVFKQAVYYKEENDWTV